MMRHAMPRSLRSGCTWVAGVLIGLQAGVLCAQEPAAPPATEPSSDATADKPALPAKKPAKTPAAPRASVRTGTKAGTSAADVAKPPQKFRLTRTGKLDPRSPLGMAVEEIRHEYERGKLRTEASYFRDTPCPDLTTDNVFILLDRKLGATAPVDAYIKWQILSSLPESLADQYKPLVIEALKNAPAPIMSAGVIENDAQRRDVQREVAQFNEQQSKAALERLDQERERIHTLNDPILAYHSALGELLAESYDGSMAAFADAYRRAQLGVEYGPAVIRGAQLARTWLKTDPPTDAVQRLAAAVVEMRQTKLNDVVSQFDWNDKSGAFQLRTEPRGLDWQGHIRALELELQKRLGTGDAEAGAAQDKNANDQRRGR